MIDQMMRHAENAAPQVGKILQEASQPVIDALSSIAPEQEAPVAPYTLDMKDGEEEVVEKLKVQPLVHKNASQQAGDEVRATRQPGMASVINKHFVEKKQEYPYTQSYQESKKAVEAALGSIDRVKQDQKDVVDGAPASKKAALRKKDKEYLKRDTKKNREVLSSAQNEMFTREAIQYGGLSLEDAWIMPFLGGMHKDESDYAVEETHNGIEGGKNKATSSYGVLMKPFPINEGETMLSQAYRYAEKNILPHFKNKKGEYKDPTMTTVERKLRASMAWNQGNGKMWAASSHTAIKDRQLSYVASGDDKGVLKKTGTDKNGKAIMRKVAIAAGTINRNLQNYNKLAGLHDNDDIKPVLYYEIARINKTKEAGVKITYTFNDQSTKVVRKLKLNMHNMSGGLDGKYYKKGSKWRPEGGSYSGN